MSERALLVHIQPSLNTDFCLLPCVFIQQLFFFSFALYVKEESIDATIYSRVFLKAHELIWG